ncbi:unnamed protein product [Musa acuminata subsp. malaccensis]|uniref:(wild Malaysian banana) hypothetical protein n=1 Tax=Musa acuminata subsp. malaccensis TaxID=214687 RepID=A0A804JZY4_MUSAM|nr:unnamed protein product [Musa acuminata subsp. malaccensis]
MKRRGEVVSITDFGGVGDGRTLNTAAFESAVSRFEQLNAPAGTGGNFIPSSDLSYRLWFWSLLPVVAILFAEKGGHPSVHSIETENIFSLQFLFKTSKRSYNIMYSYHCSNVVVRNVTILAPHDSPNTDGVDPDSSSNVCIEDCYISTGEDLVAMKSGWDEYAIAYAHPSSGITIR